MNYLFKVSPWKMSIPVTLIARLISPMGSLYIYCKRFLRFLSDPNQLLKINNRKPYPRWRTERRPKGDRRVSWFAVYRICNETVMRSKQPIFSEVFYGFWCSNDKHISSGPCVYAWPSIQYCLYFIYARKIYVRTHVKITQQWKSTFTTKLAENRSR